MTEAFKKVDRVRVRTHVGDFHGQVGTVVSVSRWVFGRPEDICYLVALNSGTDVTCDPEDLELVDDDADE